jgi:hypothetical protein
MSRGVNHAPLGHQRSPTSKRTREAETADPFDTGVTEFRRRSTVAAAVRLVGADCQDDRCGSPLPYVVALALHEFDPHCEFVDEDDIYLIAKAQTLHQRLHSFWRHTTTSSAGLGPLKVTLM